MSRPRPARARKARSQRPGPPVAGQEQRRRRPRCSPCTAASARGRRPPSGAGGGRWAARSPGSPRSRSRTRAPTGSARGTPPRGASTRGPSAGGTGAACHTEARTSRAARSPRGAPRQARVGRLRAASRPPSPRRREGSAGRDGCRSSRKRASSNMPGFCSPMPIGHVRRLRRSGGGRQRHGGECNRESP